MGSDPELENRRGLEWLVTARNKCQTLMFLLLERWETLPTFRREYLRSAARTYRQAATPSAPPRGRARRVARAVDGRWMVDALAPSTAGTSTAGFGLVSRDSCQRSASADSLVRPERESC